jgi:signal transduction histidine kinase/CheY-like chemotaxis protein
MPLLPRRLNARIVLVVSCILLATGASFGWVTAGSQAASLLEAMRRSASVMVRNIADTSAHQLLIEDYAELGEFLASTVALPDIQRLVVCEPDGKLIWDIRHNPDGPPLRLTGIDHVSPPTTVAVTTVMENDRLAIWQPIAAGRPLGWLKAEYSLASIRAGQAQIWKDAWLMTAAWVVGSALLIFLLLNPILQSIGRLTAFSKQLDEHKGERIHISDDILEIAELGASLNEASVKLFSTEQQLIGDREQLRDAEQKVRALNAELEARVRYRTAELEAANAALVLTRDTAAAASRAKSTFLANMSHELRTPMNAIMGMTSLALRHAEAPKLKNQLEKIDQASKHLLGVINDILDISKIEAERLTLERVTFKLGEVLENLTSLIGQKVMDKGLKLRVDLSPEVARLTLLGDSLRIGQILLNFAGNAVKFTDQGSVTVRALMIQDNPNDVLLRWEVLDTGIGIAAEDQKRLFTAFEQADGSMTRKYGGTGLGLAISKRLVNMMGGEVGVDSQVGSGSTFWFTVRLGKAPMVNDAVPPAPTFSQDSAETRLKSQFSGARILLAEDEPINQEVSRGLLEDVGLAVDLAEDGAIAVEMAKQTTYALILMDMQMPNLNGVDATRAIRTLPGYADTPILAMTANAFDEDRQVCLDAGMNDHIGKPVDPDKLFETLLEWLSKPRD